MQVKDWNANLHRYALAIVLTHARQETVKEIEQFADTCIAKQSRDAIKKAMVKGIPRQAVLKPSQTALAVGHTNVSRVLRSSVYAGCIQKPTPQQTAFPSSLPSSLLCSSAISHLSRSPTLVE